MRRLLILAIIAVFSNGCKKSHSDPSMVTIPTDQPPAVTAAGTPVGSPITKSIGPGGGTVLSADGRLQLNFPPNALATNTDITIQPVTNTAPGGKGVGYHLMPDGSKFSVPVTLTFNYSDSDANGTLPLLFYIAFQDSTGVWQADFKNRTVDTIARTASLSISHFSFWSLGSKVSIYAYPSGVRQNETSTIGVEITEDQVNTNPNTDGIYSPSPLPPTITPVPSSLASNWSINGVRGGDAQDGTIADVGNNTVIYTAPANIDKERMVQAAGTMTYPVKGWNKGKLVQQLNKFILFTPIDLLPRDLTFTIGVAIKILGTSNEYNDVYTDTASFQIQFKGSLIAVSDWYNEPPKVVPPSGSYGLVSATWENDGIGLTNLTDALVLFTTGDSVAVYLQNSGATVTPIWHYMDASNGTTWTEGGNDVPGYPGAVFFEVKDMVQYGINTNDGTVLETWTVTPVH